MDQAVSDLTKALEIDPKAQVYFYRGTAYYYRKEFDKSWADVNKARQLGYQVPTGFLDDLRKASGRNK